MLQFKVGGTTSRKSSGERVKHPSMDEKPAFASLLALQNNHHVMPLSAQNSNTKLQNATPANLFLPENDK